MEVLHINGLRIAFRRQGAGPPLVLLHGGLSDSRQWRRQLEALSAAFTVVAWDAPGCGQSSDPPEHFRLADYADCLAAWIAALGLERPHVLGLSFGGGLALELYQRHPTVPRTLVLASAYAGWAGSLPQEALEDAYVLAEELSQATAAGIPGALSRFREGMIRSYSYVCANSSAEVKTHGWQALLGGRVGDRDRGNPLPHPDTQSSLVGYSAHYARLNIPPNRLHLSDLRA
jgi:pimeloyl-ACP methyl ester carboxylesterase